MGFTTMFTLATIMELLECLKAGDFETISSVITIIFYNMFPQGLDGVHELMEKFIGYFN